MLGYYFSFPVLLQQITTNLSGFKQHTFVILQWYWLEADAGFTRLKSSYLQHSILEAPDDNNCTLLFLAAWGYPHSSAPGVCPLNPTFKATCGRQSHVPSDFFCSHTSPWRSSSATFSFHSCSLRGAHLNNLNFKASWLLTLIPFWHIW